MSFGDGSHGALGLPTSLTGLEPTPTSPLASLAFPLTFGVSAGHYHSLPLLLKVSSGPGAATTKPSSAAAFLPPETWNEPKRVEGLNQVQVLSASASGVVSAAIGDDGSLWVWGKSKRGQLGWEGITEALVPARVEALAREKIAKGKLFGWGYSADGRLGKITRAVEASLLDSSADMVKPNQQLPKSILEAAERYVLEGMEKEKDMPIVWDPCLVEELHGTEVVDIASGLDHSLHQVLATLWQFVELHIRRDATSIVSWGWNHNSQLGRMGPENIPLEVEGLAGERVVSVSGGRVHSIALTSKQEVWVWGCGKNGRLGLGSSADEAEPILLDSLEGYEVLQAVSGFDHNLVLITQ
ncbi:hypothetical protein GH714_023838 [Hevea brasiliensis]|uniref:Uncharacterized protein n=1 Tax=Hevea brasiliensis TaxID=3981 RepID=A0A6A6KNI7_HEVBR|nr:hypothetical protein GH714_023838 [Hevea brasiliensis]